MYAPYFQVGIEKYKTDSLEVHVFDIFLIQFGEAYKLKY